MTPDFFEKPEEKTTTEATTVKVGEKEYSQEELSALVGLGETAKEYETKWNRKISEFYPDYTQKSQKLADFERKQADEETSRKLAEDTQKQKELEEKAKSNQLTPEETKAIARQQAKELGIVTKDEFDSEVNRAVVNALAGKQLLDDMNIVISDAQEKGQPVVTPDQLLKYMQDNGVKNPEKAYKLMFEQEIDQWKEEKLKTITPGGFTTQINSTAGSKQVPPPKPITRDNLSKAILDTLTRNHGV